MKLVPERASLKMSLKAPAMGMAASDDVELSDDAAARYAHAADESSGPRWREPPPESDDEVGNDDLNDATWVPGHGHSRPPTGKRQTPAKRLVAAGPTGEPAAVGQTPPSKVRRTDEQASRPHRPSLLSPVGGSERPRSQVPTTSAPSAAAKRPTPRSASKATNKATSKQRLIKMLRKPGKLSR
jgi:hypothetical protein